MGKDFFKRCLGWTPGPTDYWALQFFLQQYNASLLPTPF